MYVCMYVCMCVCVCVNDTFSSLPALFPLGSFVHIIILFFFLIILLICCTSSWPLVSQSSQEKSP